MRNDRAFWHVACYYKSLSAVIGNNTEQGGTEMLHFTNIALVVALLLTMGKSVWGKSVW
ncbi:MAG: hypothetical protein JW876_01555 [Candidatus Krumholzibacteriota bacterium]|nr:hypothetical protein [Candidatus Krumholzibacteriota bacterium]